MNNKMGFAFVCNKCGKSMHVEKPVKARINCHCGGVMELRCVQDEGRSARNEGLPVVNPSDYCTSLMGLIAGQKQREDSRDVGDQLFRYKTVMCPHCGWIQVTEGKTRFKCRGCGKSSSYRKRGGWNVKLKDFPSMETASIYAKKWKRRLAED